MNQNATTSANRHFRRFHAAPRAEEHSRPSAAATDLTPRRAWLAVTAVALGTFSMVTVETLPIGLLTSIASGLRVSDSDVGLLVTVTGVVAALAAAAVPVLIGHIDRRTVLVGLIALTITGNALSAASPDFAVLLAARVVIGFGIGGFWSLAAGVAVRLVTPQQVPRAISVIFFGPMAANVLGVPAGTLLGSLIGWRVAFVAAAALAAGLMVALITLLPSIPATEPVRVSTLLGQLRNRGVRVGVAATFLLCSGHYGAFTFVSPILQRLARIPAHSVGVLLLAYGTFAILGNFAAGAAAARNVRATIITISLLLATVLALIPVIGRTPLMGTLLLMCWGLAFGALPVSVQTWIFKSAPTSTEAATGLNTCMFNFAIAFGALCGNLVSGTIAISGVLWLAAAVVTPASLGVWRVREL